MKLKFYSMLAEYYIIHEKNPWEACLCFHKIFEALTHTPSDKKPSDAGVMNDAVDFSALISGLAQLSSYYYYFEFFSLNAVYRLTIYSCLSVDALLALEGCVIYLILSSHNNQTNDMLHRLKLLKHTSKNAPGSNMETSLESNDNLCYQLLNLFLTNEIIPQDFPAKQDVEGKLQLSPIQSNLRTQRLGQNWFYIFTKATRNFAMINISCMYAAHVCLHKFGAEFAQPFLSMLDKRIIEHNLR